MGFAQRSRSCDRVTKGQVWQKCGKEGYPARGWMWLEIGQNFCRLLKFMIPHRATVLARGAGTLPEYRRKERPPGIFHLHERGAGWSRTWCCTRKFKKSGTVAKMPKAAPSPCNTEP